jgi:hypothetical protein
MSDLLPEDYQRIIEAATDWLEKNPQFEAVFVEEVLHVGLWIEPYPLLALNDDSGESLDLTWEITRTTGLSCALVDFEDGQRIQKPLMRITRTEATQYFKQAA